MNESADRAKDNQSLTRWFVVRLAATVLIVSALAVAAMYQVVSRAAARGLEQRADEVLAYLVGTLRPPLWSVDHEGVKAIGAAVAREESIARLAVRNEAGTVIYATEKSGESDLVSRESKVFGGEGDLKTFVGDVSVSLTPRADLAGIRQLLFFSTIVICLVLAAVLIISAASIRAGLQRQLGHLADTADRFAAGKYDEAAPAFTYREFQPFGVALTQMARTIAEQMRELRQSEEKLRVSFDQTFQFIGLLSTDGTLLKANRTALQLVGVNEEDVVGKPYWETVWWSHSPALQERVKAAVEEAAAGRLVCFEATHVAKDGHLHYVDFSLKPVIDPAGQVIQLIPEGHDITERRHAEEELARYRDSLEETVRLRTEELEVANKELESFSYSVSHDLRAPLRAIDGFAHIMLEDYGDKIDAEGKHVLEVISANVGRMGQLIEDLLHFSRISRQEMEPETVDMGELVREVFEDIRSAAPQRSIRLDLGDLPPAQGDRSMVRQVFMNLLSNAAKYTSKQAEALIEVTAVATPGGLAYRVKDNGVGFDMQYVDRLFGVFQRLHRDTDFEGTGIGLAIVKNIVTRHGGRVWAESKPGQGASFYFTLPAGASSA